MIWGNKIGTISSPKLSTKYQIISLAWAIIPLCYWPKWKSYLLCTAGQSHMCKGLAAHLPGRLVWIISNKLYSSQAGHLPENDRFHHSTILEREIWTPQFFSFSIGDRFSDAGTKFWLSSLTLSCVWVILFLCSSTHMHTHAHRHTYKQSDIV